MSTTDKERFLWKLFFFLAGVEVVLLVVAGVTLGVDFVLWFFSTFFPLRIFVAALVVSTVVHLLLFWLQRRGINWLEKKEDNK